VHVTALSVLKETQGESGKNVWWGSIITQMEFSFLLTGFMA